MLCLLSRIESECSCRPGSLTRQQQQRQKPRQRRARYSHAFFFFTESPVGTHLMLFIPGGEHRLMYINRYSTNTTAHLQGQRAAVQQSRSAGEFSCSFEFPLQLRKKRGFWGVPSALSHTHMGATHTDMYTGQKRDCTDMSHDHNTKSIIYIDNYIYNPGNLYLPPGS